MNRNLVLCILMGALSLSLLPPDALADAARLEAAIRSTGNNFKNFAIAGLSVGVAVAGLCFAVGAAQIGRMILFSIIIGAVITFGGQSIIGMLQNAFH